MTNTGAVHGAQASAAGRVYDNAWSIYAGLNYDIIGNSLKVQGGYEFSQLTDSTNNRSQIDASAVRVQLQVMF